MDNEETNQEQEIEQTEIPPIEAVERAYAEDQQDYNDYQTENAEDQQFGSYPGAIPKESIFTFFKNVLDIKDSSKVANLDRRELGMLDLSVRNCEYLAKLGSMLHNKSYNDFFMAKAEITLATSMSKKGWLPELVVSQKKFSQRTVQPMALQPAKKGFLGLGGGKPEQVQQPQ
jgi:hypothetical protein